MHQRRASSNPESRRLLLHVPSLQHAARGRSIDVDAQCPEIRKTKQRKDRSCNGFSTHKSGHGRVDISGKLANMRGVLDTPIDRETFRAIEQIVDHLVSIRGQTERQFRTCSSTGQARWYSHGRRHQVLEKGVHLSGLDAALLGERERFCKDLQAPKNNRVSDEFERGCY